MSSIDNQVQSSDQKRLALVGMDVYFLDSDGLDAFENTIYKGLQHFKLMPPARWEKLNGGWSLPTEAIKTLEGAFIEGFDFDPLLLRCATDEIDNLPAADLLLMKVAQRALRNAGLEVGSDRCTNLAVLVLNHRKTRSSASWSQLSDRFDPDESVIPVQGVFSSGSSRRLQRAAGLGRRCTPGGHEKPLAERIAGWWNFSGPAITITDEGIQFAVALEEARRLLFLYKVDTVLIGAAALIESFTDLLMDGHMRATDGVNNIDIKRNVIGWKPGEGAAAVVLKRHKAALRDKSRIYALIDAMGSAEIDASSRLQGDFTVSPEAETVEHSRVAMTTDAIGYLEIVAGRVEPLNEDVLASITYEHSRHELSCAVGSVQANIGYVSTVSGIAGLIKTALCLYNRFFPALPEWTAPKKPFLWRDGPFYVPANSRGWFLESSEQKRTAAVALNGGDHRLAHLILSEETSQKDRSNRALTQSGFHIFPLAADTPAGLVSKLDMLKEMAARSENLYPLVRDAIKDYGRQTHAKYTLCIVAHNPTELRREISFALRGIIGAFEKQMDWQTPLGSYFTPEPLGEQGEIAFVYPGAFNSYIGVGRDLFYLFPELYEHIAGTISDVGLAVREKLLYPRSWEALSKEQVADLEASLTADPIAMLSSGTSLAVLYTLILSETFAVQPSAAFGYSLGENSMMFATGVWVNGDEIRARLEDSALFRTRLSGPQNAVREHWGLPRESEDYCDDGFWSSYVLMASPEIVREHLLNEKYIYLTHINTPRQVVIAGDSESCRRVITSLGCSSLKAPFNYALHCEPMCSEYDALVELHNCHVNAVPDVALYSAADYAPLCLEQKIIARKIANTLCTCLDFPRLINSVYEDGARLFIELGAGSNCSKWIQQVLKGKPHTAMSINRHGVDDFTSIARVLARLCSHRVSVDLSPLIKRELAYDGVAAPSLYTLNMAERAR